MFAYITRRILYAIPILIGVNLITFLLFFVVNTPRDMAVTHLGDKYTTEEAIEQWIKSHGYDKPRFFDAEASGLKKITNTLIFTQTKNMFLLQFGTSDTGRDIGQDVKERMGPSLAVAIPALLFGLATNIFVALLLTFFRRSYLDLYGVSFCVALMSISSLFYIIIGQFLLGKIFRWVPISGYIGGWSAAKFVLLPVIVSVVAGVGSGARWYRTLLLEEVNKDYIRTARAKGLSSMQVLFKHALKNAMIPILTGVVVVIPTLFMGSLLLESFFSIPGLGSYTIDAIRSQDFAIVRSMVYLGAVLYIVGLILTDISYTLVDPRVRLQ